MELTKELVTWLNEFHTFVEIEKLGGMSTFEVKKTKPRLVIIANVVMISKTLYQAPISEAFLGSGRLW